MSVVGSERGAASMEAALIIPTFLIVGLMVVSLIARNQTAVALAETSAQEAARAASLQDTQSGAFRVAKSIVLDNNASSERIVCELDRFDAELEPGGFVVLDVTCSGSSSPFPGFPGQNVRKTKTAFEPVDSFRSRS